ncbi:hypothetical protein QFZ24_009829 [Streptomyces phaeochromogenes]|nr:hypothetical protein [Streptomyces phaeochromogenes]
MSGRRRTGSSGAAGMPWPPGAAASGARRPPSPRTASFGRRPPPEPFSVPDTSPWFRECFRTYHRGWFDRDRPTDGVSRTLRQPAGQRAAGARVLVVPHRPARGAAYPRRQGIRLQGCPSWFDEAALFKGQGISRDRSPEGCSARTGRGVIRPVRRNPAPGRVRVTSHHEGLRRRTVGGRGRTCSPVRTPLGLRFPLRSRPTVPRARALTGRRVRRRRRDSRERHFGSGCSVSPVHGA